MSTILELFLTFFRISFFTVGGGYAMIPLFQKELVIVHEWITAGQMLDMLAVAEMTPGPLAINLATYAGYHTAGVWGAVAATTGVVAPSGLIILVITRFLGRFQDIPVVRGILRGIRPMVVALITVAALNIARVALEGWVEVGILLVALVTTIIWRMHPIVVLLAAGILGILMGL